MSRSRTSHPARRLVALVVVAAAVSACFSPTDPSRYGAPMSSPASDGELAAIVGDTLALVGDVIAVGEDEVASCQSGDPAIAQVIPETNNVVALTTGVASIWCRVTHRALSGIELIDVAENEVATYVLRVRVGEPEP